MLLHVPVGGTEEVREVMATAPGAWKNVLVLETVPSVTKLQVRISDYEGRLLQAVDDSLSKALTIDELHDILKDMDLYHHMQDR